MNTLQTSYRRGQYGFTLVELMISMTLGLLIMLGLTNVYLAQRQAYRTNDDLADMLSNGRTAFELLAREIRESGLNPCGAGVVSTELHCTETSTCSTWLNWDDGGIHGYESSATAPDVAVGTAAGERVAGTDALVLRSATLGGASIITSHASTTAALQLNGSGHGFVTSDLLMACDYKRAAIFRATGVSGSSISHAQVSGASNNCNDGFPASCGVSGGHVFDTNGSVSRVTVSEWYVGNNSRGGRSLFRIVNGGTAQEIAEGVSNLQLQYLTRTGTSPASDYVDATAVGSWTSASTAPVIAVRTVFTVSSRASVGIDESTGNLTQMTREIVQVVSRRGFREVLL